VRRGCIHIVAADASHTRLAAFALLYVAAFAAGSEKGILPGSLESQKLGKGLVGHRLTDKCSRNRVAAVVTANKSVAIVDSHSEISGHAATTASEQTARHCLNLLLGDHIITVRALHEISLHHPCHRSRPFTRIFCWKLLLLMQRVGA
jgi:hypothetical protein